MRTCEDIQARLSLLVDGGLSAEDQATVRSHVRGCAACRGMLADLDRLRAAARELGPIAPPDHLWLEVAGQIRQSAPLQTHRVPRRIGRNPIWQWAGLAAAMLLVTFGAYLVRPSTPQDGSGPTASTNAPTATTAGASNPAAGGSVETVAQELNMALAHYEKAIGELETMARAGNSTIEPALAATMQKNLSAIDQAIAQSRTALVDNPSSEPARTSLFEALRRKISVLQTTVALMNQMRLGDADGAARLAAGAGKKS